MADDGAGEISRDDLIAEISGVQDELESLEVKRERIQFYKFRDDELPEVLESVSKQLKVRQRFLGEKV